MSDYPGIRSDQRVFFVGKTGSGKTYSARALLSSADIVRLVVVDAKGTFDPGQWRAELCPIAKLSDRMRDDEYRLIIRPTPDEFGEVGRVLAAERDYIVYIDEMYYLFQSGAQSKMLADWQALWTRGRELKIGVWCGVQRPSRIPLFAMSEADHYFVFRLSMREDRQRIAEIIGLENLPGVKTRYGFLYAEPGREIYRLYGEVKLTKSARSSTIETPQQNVA